MARKIKSTFDSIEKTCNCATKSALSAGEIAASQQAYKAADFVALGKIRGKGKTIDYNVFARDPRVR